MLYSERHLCPSIRYMGLYIFEMILRLKPDMHSHYTPILIRTKHVPLYCIHNIMIVLDLETIIQIGVELMHEDWSLRKPLLGEMEQLLSKLRSRKRGTHVKSTLSRKEHLDEKYTDKKSTLSRKERWEEKYTGKKSTLSRKVHWEEKYTE